MTRVASGQKIPETGENVDESGLLSPTKTEGSTDEGGEKEGGATSEDEDIADRAASLLQGLRGAGEGIVSEAPSRDESLRVRRRRETADDERTRRRERRRRAGTSTDAGAHSTTIEETETLNEEENEEESRRSSGERQLLTSPVPETIVVPPSPTTSERGRADEK